MDKLKGLNTMAAKQRQSKDLQQKLGKLNSQVEGLGTIKKLADISKGFAAPAAAAAPKIEFTPPSLNALKEKVAAASAKQDL